MAISEVYKEDCMLGMARYPDNYFDLAVVDPPYGIGMDRGKIGSDNKYTAKSYTTKNWDTSSPDIKYFIELKRVSKNQIIWGANHFISKIPDHDSPSWIVWNKLNAGNFADCELAYTSHKKAVRSFDFKWAGMLQGNMKNKEVRIHPTQKPVALYDWIFQNYAEPGFKILDTHLGSGSSRIAAHKHKLDFVGFEIDAEYFAAAEKRYQDFISQLTLF